MSRVLRQGLVWYGLSGSKRVSIYFFNGFERIDWVERVYFTDSGEYLGLNECYFTDSGEYLGCMLGCMIAMLNAVGGRFSCGEWRRSPEPRLASASLESYLRLHM